MQQLDELDKRILTILQDDASIGLKALAEQTFCSLSTCQRRVQALIERKVIIKQVALVNPVAVGRRISVFVMVEMENQNPQQKQVFERRMQQEAEVMSCYEISGDYDFLLLVHSESMESYHAFTCRVFTSENYVRRYKSQFIMNFSKVGNRIVL
ncbi:Lrp/AsnC family transcriptional regulator [Volucribacter amazonae]|uniref:AsnC family transcriptional regulator n=1 Tax=Volucribacter amazonae TaxID=256731 RepID=A0A9X4PAJ6_9PAST|nr:Lrp/AsnC family transcriptional regulator [Volucribacter amazonae]MDG6894114.1 AsnC family transcriptional regulator [Volucribacter amazonae]